MDQRRQRKLKFLMLALSGAILTVVFAPIPGDAVSINLANVNTIFDENGADDFDMALTIKVSENAVNPSGNPVIFSNGDDQEALPHSSVIRITFNPGTSIQKSALFDFDGVRLSDDLITDGTADTAIISSLDFNGVRKSGTSQYAGFSYGNFYGYGYGFFGGTGYDYGIIGNNTYGYGLSPRFFTADAEGAYTLIINPHELPNGNNLIRVDLLETATSTEFFTSGNVVFANTVIGTPTEVNLAAGAAKAEIDLEVTVLSATSTDLAEVIELASVSVTIDFDSLTTTTTETKTLITTSTEPTVVQTTNAAAAAATVRVPPQVQISGPPTWTGNIETNLQVAETVANQAVTTLGVTAEQAVKVGEDGIRLTFSKPIKIIVPGSGNSAPVFNGVPAGSTTTISRTIPLCPATISNAATDAAREAAAQAHLILGNASQEDCYFVNGAGNTEIWSLHASTFITVNTPTGQQVVLVTGEAIARGGGGGGGGGGGPVIPGVSSAAIYEISWDICEANTISVTAGPPGPGLTAKARTSVLGVVQGELADDQPHEGRTVFEIPVDPSETYALIQVEGIAGRGASIAQKSINLNSCTGSIVVNEYKPPQSGIVTAPSTTPTQPTITLPQIEGLLPIATPTVVVDFVNENTKVSNANTGDALSGYVTLKSGPDNYAKEALGIDGQSVTTIAYVDRLGHPESNGDLNVFLQIRHTGDKVNSMAGVELGSDRIMIITDDGSSVTLPRSAEISIPDRETVSIPEKTSLKLESADSIKETPAAVLEFLNNNIEIVNDVTGDDLTYYYVVQTVDDVFAQKELGIEGQYVTTIAMPDLYGRADSNDDLNIFIQFSHTDEKVNSARAITLGGHGISVIVNGEHQGSITQTKELM